MKTIEFDKKKLDLSYVKSESFRFLAHDINNVFNNIRSSAELCKIFLDNTAQINKVQEQLNLINGQIARGIKLISNARYLSQVKDLSDQKEQVELIGMLDSVINNVKKNFLDKQINIKVNTIDKKIFIKANKLIIEVFENLFNNAVLHNLNYSIDITVEIKRVSKENKNYLEFQFIDNGVGISDPRKEWIFNSSFLKDQHGRGMGFGLSLVKEIIESYNGFIWVENRIKDDYNKGSNFKVIIPYDSEG